ncbi:MAG TPA: GAF and ANTAR domain-containing protein [Mycobacterium sp.]|nr:GAF and ANTAR domain-containing protein [Mycobacterium sp.]
MADDSRVDLARVLGELAVELQDQSDIKLTLEAIVNGAVEIVPGVSWAGVSVINDRKVESPAPSDELVAELDGVQASLYEGPCLSALREHHTVLIADMAAETRWPRFARAAVERGVLSMLAFQLYVRRENLGALNLYGRESGVFDEESIAIAQVLAQHASVALMGAESESQFQAALASRDVIGQAKGILMYRENLSGLQAFRLLLGTSQRANIKLAEIARWVVEQHESGLKQNPE